jgi:beta-N-acetylhexosaminidase
MELEKAIGRMLMLGFRGASMDDPETRADVEDLKKAHAGGVILFDQDLGTGGERNIQSKEQLKKLIVDLRHELGDDLIVAVDEEGGEVSRLRKLIHTTGAAELSTRTELILTMGISLAMELHELGINLNFAPCVDIAINPDSSIIAKRGRSFGTDPVKVTQCIEAYLNGFDCTFDPVVRCCLKHFPGHGSAVGDTHEGLVDITDTHQPGELEPYREMFAIHGGGVCVMTGHLMHREYDPVYPASLSHAITSGWLREELGFHGVVVTDSLDMSGAAIEGAPLLAAHAGADILLYGNNTPAGFIPGMASTMHTEVLAGINPERALEAASRINMVFR